MLDNKKKAVRDQIPNIKAKFKFLPNVATADLAFEAFGKDYSELFQNAGLALQETMVDTNTVNIKTDREFETASEKIEDALFAFLQEMVFLKDAEELVFSQVVCKVKKEKGKWRLKAKFFGEKLNYKTHKIRDDVKAVTKHLFEVKEVDFEVYACRVVLDV